MSIVQNIISILALQNDLTVYQNQLFHLLKKQSTTLTPSIAELNGKQYNALANLKDT